MTKKEGAQAPKIKQRNKGTEKSVSGNEIANNFPQPDFDFDKITPKAIKTDVDAGQIVSTNNVKIISATELLNRKIENIPCLIEPIFHKVGLAAIAGSSDTGKSSLMRYLCMCLVSGKSDFLGFPINVEHKKAIYVSTEDDDTAVSYLLGKQNKDMLCDHFDGLRFIFEFEIEKILQTLDEALNEQPSDIVCIDAFTDLYGRSMNESSQVRCFLNDYSQLAQKHKCLILFLHHCGKRTDELPPSKHNLLGSQAFEAKMRLVMELRNDNLDNNLKHLCIVKGNYLPITKKNESLLLRFTENMTFINTGERIPFENLTKKADERQIYERIKEYKLQGLTHEEIAPKVGYKSKGQISKIVKKFENNTEVSKGVSKETQETEQETHEKDLPFGAFPSEK